MTSSFDYNAAFARNIGWLTREEQSLLRSRRIAIAGCGGVGGSHLLTLTRLGIGAFHIADFDVFEPANFNRQAGASISQLGRPKVDVLAEMARDINPEIDIRTFPRGINDQNVDEFLAGVDIYVDGLDFFAVQARRMVFAACERYEIPAVTAAPLGMGTALLTFLPGAMSFEQYFRLEGLSEQDQLIRFLIGLSPAMLQRSYLAEPSAVNLAQHRGPSTPMACDLCAGVAATETLKILLGRGKVIAAPWGQQYDAYRNRLKRTWRPGGNQHPLQRLAFRIAQKQLARMETESIAVPETGPNAAMPVIEQVLEQARWAPSGDNTQPWRFEIHDSHSVIVHGHDTRADCVYDLDGHASHIALGALLETISIAASSHGLEAEVERDPQAADDRPTFRVTLHSGEEVTPNPLAPFIPIRATQRRPMRMQPLSSRQKQLLQEAVGEGFQIRWFESFADRARVARLLVRSAIIRLTTPEAFAVHSRIIDWHARFSEQRIPDQATGLDPMARQLTRWAFADWNRVRFLNRYLAGTVLPRVELDLLPALACGAHFAIVRAAPVVDIDDYVDVGRAWQRFWLTATSLGLWSQPEMTPLIFARYARNGIAFTDHRKALLLAHSVNDRLAALLAPYDHTQTVVMGRLGKGPKPVSRSLRRPLDELRTSSTAPR